MDGSPFRSSTTNEASYPSFQESARVPSMSNRTASYDWGNGTTMEDDCSLDFFCIMNDSLSLSEEEGKAKQF
jgi:hypothetical protein